MLYKLVLLVLVRQELLQGALELDLGQLLVGTLDEKVVEAAEGVDGHVIERDGFLGLQVPTSGRWFFLGRGFLPWRARGAFLLVLVVLVLPRLFLLRTPAADVDVIETRFAPAP